MKIEKHLLPRMSIEDFADMHDLVMEIHERGKVDREYTGWAYYAKFKDVGIVDDLDGHYTALAFGNGHTEEEAIRAYATGISEKTIIVDAGKKTEGKINVPVLVRRAE